MKDLNGVGTFVVSPIGFVISELKELDDCPLQESEGAPEAFIQFQDPYREGIKDIQTGDQLIILTWLHLANREVVKCYKRNDVGSGEFGVFSTRSPDRPNPIGFHVVTVMEVTNQNRIKIFPIEALSGTPVIDI